LWGKCGGWRLAVMWKCCSINGYSGFVVVGSYFLFKCHACCAIIVNGCYGIFFQIVNWKEVLTVC